MTRKNACDPPLCTACGSPLLPGRYSLCMWCRTQRVANRCTGAVAARVRQTADKPAAAPGLRACLCGRQIRWAYEYCWWCREAIRVEDAAAELRGPDDSRITLAEHAGRKRGIYDYNNMCVEVLPRNPDGTLQECSNYAQRHDKTEDGWW